MLDAATHSSDGAGVVREPSVEDIESVEVELRVVERKNRDYGSRNPRAQYRDQISVEEVLAARPVAPPLTLLMCCPTSSGAAAAVVASEDVARRARAPM